MSGYREQMDGKGVACRRRKWVKWAKRQMSKYRRRLGKRVIDLPRHLTRGWES